MPAKIRLPLTISGRARIFQESNSHHDIPTLGVHRYVRGKKIYYVDERTISSSEVAQLLPKQSRQGRGLAIAPPDGNQLRNLEVVDGGSVSNLPYHEERTSFRIAWWGLGRVKWGGDEVDAVGEVLPNVVLELLVLGPQPLRRMIKGKSGNIRSRLTGGDICM